MASDYVTQALGALIDWIERDPSDATIGALHLGRFLALGSKAIAADTVPRVPSSERLTRRQLATTRRELLDVLDGGEPRPLRSLAFGVARSKGRPAKLPRGAGRRREVESAVSFRLVVSGTRRDLAIYVLMRLLGEPDAAQLARCPAPAPGDRSATCGRWFLARGAKRRGRPQLYCSETCRKRAHRALYN